LREEEIRPALRIRRRGAARGLPAPHIAESRHQRGDARIAAAPPLEIGKDAIPPLSAKRIETFIKDALVIHRE
jgi:hypothetical protein